MKNGNPQKPRQSTRKKIKKSLGPDFLDPSNIGSHSAKETKTETKAEDIKCEICKESCSPKSPKGPSISCHVCKTAQAHNTCVRNRLNKRHTHTVWKCLDCKPCFRCEEGRSENNHIVYCMHCKAPYHFKCALAHWKKGVCVVCDKYHPNKKTPEEERRELARKREIELERAAHAARSASTSASTSTSTSASVSASASATASSSTATTTSTSTSVPTPEETKKSGASLLTGPNSSSRKTRSATSSNNSLKSSTGDTSSPSSSSSSPYKRETRALGRLRRSAGEQTPDENSQTSTRSSKRGYKHTRSTAKKAKRDVDSESNSGSDVDDSEKKIETDDEGEETKNEGDDKMNRSSSSSLNDSTSIPSGSQPQESQASIANDLDPDESNVEENVDLDNDDKASEVSEPQGSVVPMDASIDEQPTHDENSSETPTDIKQNDEASPKMEIDTESKAENLDEDADNKSVSDSQSVSNSKLDSSQDQLGNEAPKVQNARRDSTNAVNADNLLEKSETTNKSTTEAQVNGSDKAPSGVSSRIMKDANGSAKLKSALFERIYKVGGLLPAETSDWTVDDVGDFIKFLGFPKEAENFVTNQIDGKSLLLLTRQDVLTGFKMKLGPALKIYAHIFCLQRKKPSLLLEDQ